MALLYTEEQKELIALVRDMAEHEIKPYVQEADEKGECPRELFDWGFKMGLHMLEIPAQYGGTGLSYETTAMIFEELAKVDAGYAITFVTTFVALRNVILAGTPEQAQYFADIINRGSFAGFALTEPNAGSDPAGIRGSAVLDGDEYVLNATKTFITNGALSDIYVGFFKTSPEAGHKGISAFIIDRNTPGVSVGAHENKMGLRLSNTTDLIFENVRVPKENLLGGEGQGFKICMATLNSGRITVATQGLRIAQGALDEAVKYVKERVQFGKPIAKLQNTQFEIADMATRVECGRQLVYNAARLKDAGQPYSKNAAMAKYYCGDLCNNIAYRSLQLHGGYGYMKDYPIERMFRDARLVAIYEGTSEIQRVVIANHILGK